MNEPKAVFFTEEDYKMILEYKRAIGAKDVQTAILNAISLALDHHDDSDYDFYGERF